MVPITTQNGASVVQTAAQTGTTVPLTSQTGASEANNEDDQPVNTAVANTRGIATVATEDRARPHGPQRGHGQQINTTTTGAAATEISDSTEIDQQPIVQIETFKVPDPHIGSLKECHETRFNFTVD